MDQNRITKVKMTMTLIDVNERLVSNFYEINYKGLRPIVVWLGSGYHRLHLVG